MTLTKMWLKSLVRFPVDFPRAEACLQRRPQDRESSASRHRPIVLEMTTPQLQFDCGRHLNAISLHATMIDSPFYVRCGRVLLAAMARKLFGKDLLGDKNFHWLRPDDPLPDDALVLRDGPKLPRGRSESHTHARLMIGRDHVPGTDVMPYPMHPHTLARLPRIALATLRDTPDRRGIFFAGRLKENYGNIRQHFGVMTRLEIIDCLHERFASRVQERLDQPVSERSITLVDTKAHPITPDDWLPTLASRAFFVGCPGVCQPMCHNVVEAMSVGTIPILEYDDRFTPALVDGDNAICFRGRDGLLGAITRIDQLSADEIAQMRRRVVDYYENHLRGDRFLSRLRDRERSSADTLISMPFHDQNFWARSA